MTKLVEVLDEHVSNIGDAFSQLQAKLKIPVSYVLHVVDPMLNNSLQIPLPNFKVIYPYGNFALVEVKLYNDKTGRQCLHPYGTNIFYEPILQK